KVTYDFARLMEGAKEVKCSEFGDAVIVAMDGKAGAKGTAGKKAVVKKKATVKKTAKKAAAKQR
ncbi:MAG TPA: hypothetical protein VI547_13300, partial [Anaerolineales bacterium]|nr:hypothetical protein [Anaerolineales bacterium]